MVSADIYEREEVSDVSRYGEGGGELSDVGCAMDADDTMPDHVSTLHGERERSKQSGELGPQILRAVSLICFTAAITVVSSLTVIVIL